MDSWPAKIESVQATFLQYAVWVSCILKGWIHILLKHWHSQLLKIGQQYFDYVSEHSPLLRHQWASLGCHHIPRFKILDLLLKVIGSITCIKLITTVVWSDWPTYIWVFLDLKWESHLLVVYHTHAFVCTPDRNQFRLNILSRCCSLCLLRWALSLLRWCWMPLSHFLLSP